MRLNLFLLLALAFIALTCRKGLNDETIPPPVLEKDTLAITTNIVRDLTLYSAILGGRLTDTGKSAVIEVGLVADTTPAPAIGKNIVKFKGTPDSSGYFSINVSNIPPDKKWYLRAYGINKEGVKYGNLVQFTSFHDHVIYTDVNITSQSELVTFGNNHYTRIRGSLNLSGPINDLAPLKDLVIIGNGLGVNNTQLTDFKGLEKLEIIGNDFIHDFKIANNSLLKHFTGLNKLREVDGNFEILNNDALADLTGLENLYTLYNSEFRIDDCNSITSIHGLENMVSVLGDIVLKNDPVLTDLSAWKQLKIIFGRLSIENCSSLQKLDGFDGITGLESIELTGNTALHDISGLKNIDTIGQGITIDDNDALLDLASFNKLRTLNTLTIENNDLLPDLTGFSNLTAVPQLLHIENNGRLVNMHGLERLKLLSKLEILSNNNLKDLKGLDSLSVIQGNIYSISIDFNAQLQSLAGLENLAKADGQVAISNNNFLTDFCPLKTLLSGGYNNTFFTQGNAVNPASLDIINNCP